MVPRQHKQMVLTLAFLLNEIVHFERSLYLCQNMNFVHLHKTRLYNTIHSAAYDP